MRKKMLLSLLCAISICSMVHTTATAKTTYRYTTQTVSLKEYGATKAPTVTKVKRNAKLTLVKRGATWSKVKYNKMPVYVRTKYLSSKKAVKKYTGARFKWLGVVKYNGASFTWYSQRVLPGRGLKIPGRHLDKQGFVCDSNGYIVLGSSTSNRGRIIATPFGKFGKVYDAGCGGSKWYDCYVGW